MTELQQPQSCNTDATRRASQAACEAAYVKSEDGSIQRCIYDAARGRPCRLLRSTTYTCSDQTDAFQCGDLKSMMALLPGVWCNNDVSRRASRRICETTFFYQANGNVRLCKHDAIAGKCIADGSTSYSCSVPPGPPPLGIDSPFTCEDLGSMLDVRSLLPPQWCGSDTERSNDMTACETTYATKENGRVARCKYDDGRSKCILDQSVEYDCPS
eukprot:CAMPEP_0183366706 /NCGR_PEP_ID=MMETSP0164_2-20130417/89779_1 /TAXON_ID=221442 /ORGANISM="Coccolithus pelagicus ssp braarudi, Strain PLY182g" /LENGTH=213 /DNA_ID=CAMNT_0025542491 /DNA_START=6 /DNA_END=647 /DNA_ORIENTATION=+